jgi:alpha-galactosidase
MLDLKVIQSSKPSVVFTDPADEGFPITITQEWGGPRVRTKVRNDGDRPVRIHEVVMADVAHGMPGETKIYGEAFTHLSMTTGTIAEPQDIGKFTDRGHYKLPQPEGARTVYGMLLLSPPGQGHTLLGFSTCLRYCGKIHLRDDSVQAVLDTEDIAIEPGEVWSLEDMVLLQGPDRAAVLREFAGRLAEHHRADSMPDLPPTGWCSWYCFGSKTTVDDVRRNQDYIVREMPQLKFIQIDDGYQAAFGDWLETGNALGGKIQEVIKEIRDGGCEPAIWVAPFCAQKDSKVFAEHPEWFVKDPDGNPMPSNRVTFGGWHFGPWYCLDSTNPEVQTHLLNIFKTMRFEWGIKYFKLDACYWGAIQGGKWFDPKATRIHAYRTGLRAIQRGCDWTFMLACNHPTWASLGICQGWRTSTDIGRSWNSFYETGKQNLMRNWMNGATIWNDPDCICLTGDLPENEYQFHATVIYASGGAILSGDDLPAIPSHRLPMLTKLLPPTGAAAAFTDETLQVGYIDLPNKRMVCLLNWDDEPKKLTFQLDGQSLVKDFWTDEELGQMSGVVEMELAGRSARLLECRNSSQALSTSSP